jgi:hypothetical protein
MKYARMNENTVGEIFTPPTGIDISECFTEEVVALFISILDNVDIGWIRLPDGSFTPPPTPAIETGSITVTDLGA